MKLIIYFKYVYVKRFLKKQSNSYQIKRNRERIKNTLKRISSKIYSLRSFYKVVRILKSYNSFLLKAPKIIQVSKSILFFYKLDE